MFKSRSSTKIWTDERKHLCQKVCQRSLLTSTWCTAINCDDSHSHLKYLLHVWAKSLNHLLFFCFQQVKTWGSLFFFLLSSCHCRERDAAHPTVRKAANLKNGLLPHSLFLIHVCSCILQLVSLLSFLLNKKRYNTWGGRDGGKGLACNSIL